MTAWTFQSKHVRVVVEQHTTPTPGYVRGYRLMITDDAAHFSKGGIDIGLERANYDDTIETFMRAGALVISDGPTTLDALFTKEAHDCAVKLIGYMVGKGLIPESHIALKDGVPHVIRLADDGQAMNGLR